MDVGFKNSYHNPLLRTGRCRRRDILAEGFGCRYNPKKFIILNDPGPSIDMEPDPVGEIYEKKPHVRILGNIAQARHHSVPSVLRIRKSFLIEHANESGQSCAKRSVSFSSTIGSPNKHHFLLDDESLHQRVEVTEYLVAIEGIRA